MTASQRPPADIREGLALGAIALLAIHLGYSAAVAVVDLTTPGLPAAEPGRVAARLLAPALLAAAIALAASSRNRSALAATAVWAGFEMVGGPALGSLDPARILPLLLILPLLALVALDAGAAARRVGWPTWLAVATFVALATITAAWTPADQADGWIGTLPAAAPLPIALAAVVATMATARRLYAVAAFPVLAGSAIRALTWDTLAGSRADDGFVLLAAAATALLAVGAALAAPPAPKPRPRLGILGRGVPRHVHPEPTLPPRRRVPAGRPDQDLVNRRRRGPRRYPIPLRSGNGPLIVFPEGDEEA